MLATKRMLQTFPVGYLRREILHAQRLQKAFVASSSTNLMLLCNKARAAQYLRW
jgi:hypothetical protein